MKLAFITESLGSGGAERVLCNVVNALSNEGFECDIIIFKGDEEPFYELNKNVRVINLDYEYTNKSTFGTVVENITRLIKLRKAISENKANIYISFMAHCNIRVAISCLLMKQKFVFCEHNNYFAFKGYIRRGLRLLAYAIQPKIITVLTDRDKSNYPVFLQKKIKVLKNPLGIEVSESQLLSLNKRKKIILAVGRLTKQKGYERLLLIYKTLKARGLSDEWKLYIAGDGEDRKSLIDIAVDYKINNDVCFLGNVRDIAELYKHSSIYVMTSHWEGLPMVLGEAMQFGLPVCSFDCPTGPKEFITQGVNGYLIENGDIDKFCSCIENLISNTDIRDSFGKQARISSYDYSMSNIKNEWIRILNKL